MSDEPGSDGAEEASDVPTRLDKWSKPRELGFGVVHSDGENARKILDLHREINKDNSEDQKDRTTISDILRPCRELIYDERDGKIIFHAISHYINSEKMIIEVGPLFEVSSDGDGRSEEDEAIDMLAMAAIEEVPVFPNRAEQLGRLTALHRRLLTEGFTAPDGEGSRVRLKFAKRPTLEFLEVQGIREIDCSITIFPAEIALIREVALREISRLSRAEAVLSALDRAIIHLEEEISQETRNENSIQRCITSNPILFGVEYIEIVPKHQLGSEYEMDYAAKRFNGMFDLVELESSNLAVYNRNGNPSQHLVHAEQQVLDWLAWIEDNHSYASRSLPGISNPVGFIIIGRRKDMSEEAKDKLRRRNIYWNGRIAIFTYDDLLDRSKNFRDRLNADIARDPATNDG